MRITYVNKVIFMTLMSMAISIPVYAEWNKEDNKWVWMECNKATKGWREIKNKWYHFDENGYMDTGWVNEDNKWYMLNDDGTMVSGWKQIDGNWYYFNEDGVMQLGWVQQNDKWYHLSSNGSMDKGQTKISEYWYMFDENGVMLTGWINDNDDTWYYADSNGRLESGNISIDGKDYTFSENCAMLSGSKDESTRLHEENYDKKGYVNTNSDFLNVRSEASIDSTVIDKLSRGTEINIVGNLKNGFYPIMLNGKKLWVSSEWISFEKPQDLQSNIVEDKNNNVISLGSIRTVAPSLNDIHYYSDANIFYKARLSPPFFNSLGNQIRGNCTWYAWGRIWELTGKQPIDANFTGNAYEWWEANKISGKYKYGNEPRVGALAVWSPSLPGSGECGHVAVVEKIDNDKTYISESMWHGDCFKYKEIYSTQYLYGYIYLDEPNY